MCSIVRSFERRLRGTPFHPQWLLGERTEIASIVEKIACGMVLDIGCADRWIEKYLPDGCSYVATDYLVTGVRYNSTPDLFSDAGAIPIANGVINTVLLLEVLEHLREPEQALAEIGRVLITGGHLIMTVPFIYPIHDAPHDFQRLTVHGLKWRVERAGLEVVDIRPTLGAVETSGLLMSIALAGVGLAAVKRRSPSMFMLPLCPLAILLINLSAKIFSRLMPAWDAITSGYIVVARKS